jgi:hypothetical protein
MKRDLAVESSATISQPFSYELVPLLGNGSLGHPRWIGVYAGGWEIVVYERKAFWEACFFNGHDHHEHLKATSMEGAQHEAKCRIDSLQMTCSCSSCVGALGDISQVTTGSVRRTRKSISSAAGADSAMRWSEN